LFFARLKITFLIMINQLGAGLEVHFALSIVTILSSSMLFNSILAALMSFTIFSTNYLITMLEKPISTSNKSLDLLITQIKNLFPRLSSKLENLLASQKRKKVSTIGCDIFMKNLVFISQLPYIFMLLFACFVHTNPLFKAKFNHYIFCKNCTFNRKIKKEECIQRSENFCISQLTSKVWSRN